MILCPNHHDEATQGVMLEAEQRELKEKPFNLREGRAEGALSVAQREAEILIGDDYSDPRAVVLRGFIPLLKIEGESLLALQCSQEGAVLLGARLYGEDDVLLATITDNVWEAIVPMPWDIEFRYRNLTVRSGARKISLDIDTQGERIKVRGRLWRYGRCWELGSNGVTINNGLRVPVLQGLTLERMEADLDRNGTVRLTPRPSPTPLRHPTVQKPGRNDRCWCGSGKKYKKCHGP